MITAQPKPTLKPAPTLTEDQREVLRTIASYQDDHRPYVRIIAAEAGVPVERVRQILRDFDSRGWVTHGQVFDSDSGMTAGSTWWLTKRGLAARRALEADEGAGG